MKPTLGWTMLSREEMRQAERLTSGDQDTRDEIGFLLIHQGFADRFFPGTSVLHTRVRYALFVPWLFQHAAENKPRGSDLNAAIRRDMIRLAIRLKKRERYDVIGGDVLGRLSSQPPDQVYWTALKLWGILLSGINTRSEALRRLQASVRKAPLDDDGGSLDEDATEVFSSLPKPPTGWDNPESELDFKMSPREQDYLRRKLGLLTRPGDTAQSLLARLAEARNSYPASENTLPRALDVHADADDKPALKIARDAAALSAIGRAVYGALVEHLRVEDGRKDDSIFRAALHSHFDEHAEAASRCDLAGLKALLPTIPSYVNEVLSQTQEYVRGGKPEAFLKLRASYQYSEVMRKTGRARLANTLKAIQRRNEWEPGRHNITPLHYRWSVRKMLNDLSSQS
jgi:hypothetical protein